MKITSAFVLAGMLAFSGSAFAASTSATADTTVKPAAAATTATTATPAATATTTAVAKPAKPEDPQKQAISKKCSADADAKGLHGKERKKFRDDCKSAAMAAAKKK